MAIDDAHVEHNNDFHNDFYHMSYKVKRLFTYYQERLEKKEKKNVTTEGDASETKEVLLNLHLHLLVLVLIPLILILIIIIRIRKMLISLWLSLM